MVDRQSRTELAEALRRLIGGELTNDEFDDLYYESWWQHSDDAVRELAQFGWSLYDSDTLRPYTLTGPNAPSPERQQMAERAIRFLKTDFEYEWPPGACPPVPFFCPWGPGFYLLSGMALLLLSLSSRGWTAAWTALFGVLALWPGLHWVATYRSRTRAYSEFLACGDFDVWPFLHRDEYEAVVAEVGQQ